jgi:hypothetical protein
MKPTIRRGRPIGLLVSMLLVVLAFTVLFPGLKSSSMPVSAHFVDTFGPACGMATMDGNVDPVEWQDASTQTFPMVSPGGADPFTATLYVMNGGYSLYMGITINDDEFTPAGEYLPQGDGFRIDFDNDHSGSLFAQGDDVLGIAAGFPQFDDRFIPGLPNPSTSYKDSEHGGTTDGTGAASRIGGLNHFELKHALCSADSHDFCLHPTALVGFRLEYLDAQADGSFGGSQYFPDHANTSEADIVIGQCAMPDAFLYLPLIKK